MRAVLLAALAGTALGAAAPAAAQDSYPLLCKTPLPIETGWCATVSFKRAPGPAGANGAALKSGECAWSDRAISAEEGDVLNIWPDDIAGNEDRGARYNFIAALSFNLLAPNRVFTFNARGVKDPAASCPPGRLMAGGRLKAAPAP